MRWIKNSFKTTKRAAVVVGKTWHHRIPILHSLTPTPWRVRAKTITTNMLD